MRDFFIKKLDKPRNAWYNIIKIKERKIHNTRKGKTMMKMTYENHEDNYTNRLYDIIENGKVVGGCSIMVDDNSAYCERIDIDEEYRNRGYGTQALNDLAEMYGSIIVAPDNEDAQRLYDRLGYEYNGEDAEYIDQGYGVYEI